MCCAGSSHRGQEVAFTDVVVATQPELPIARIPAECSSSALVQLVAASEGEWGNVQHAPRLVVGSKLSSIPLSLPETQNC
jgi:hypothetical protein